MVLKGSVDVEINNTAYPYVRSTSKVIYIILLLTRIKKIKQITSYPFIAKVL